MTIGNTTGKEPDPIQDEDLMSLDEMRGAMKDLGAAALTRVERATVNGVLIELDLVKQQMLKDEEQMNRLVGLYMTLKSEFAEFRAMHARSMSVRINGGSTTPEDIDDGPIHKSGD